MAVKATIASGNWTAAGTWGLVDATSYSNTAETAHIVTTAYSGTRTTSFTPGAITVSHIGVKLAVRSGTTGTFSIHLALNATHVEVAGTLVTINCSDFPVAATADLNGGWHFFKLATPVTLAAATAYEIECTTSNASQISLFRDATAGNVARALITTTTGAPAAGDDVIINGEYTGTGTSNSFTVTMDETATTDYGAASTSLVTPALAICNKGTLAYGTTGATNYYLRVSGNIIVYSGGIFYMGNPGSEIPRTSTAKLNIDCGANVDFGLIVRNLGTFKAQGLSRTISKNIVSCKLNTDEAIASTSLGVDTDTGWLDNDEIAVASTSRTIGDCESGALNGNAAASVLTVDGFAGAGGGLAVAHSGTSPTQAEVILLTRNVQIFGVSTTIQTYFVIEATSTVDCDWAEFRYMGSSTTNKRGINLNTTTGTCSFDYCSFRNWEVSSSAIIVAASSASTTFNFSNCIMYRLSQIFGFSSATATSWTITGCIFMSQLGGTGIQLANYSGTFTNNTMIGFITTCVTPLSSGTTQSGGSFNNNTMHSNSGAAIAGTVYRVTFSNTTIWRHNTYPIQLAGMTDVVFDTITIFGCSGASIFPSNSPSGIVTIIALVSNGDSTFSTANGFGAVTNNVSSIVKFIDCDFSTVSGIKTAHTTSDFISGTVNSTLIVECVNCKFGASTFLSGQTNLTESSYITSQKHNQVAGAHKTFKCYGTIELSTTQAHSDTKSMKMSPLSSTRKLESSGKNGGFKVQVASGQTCTPSVYVFEDASYNGNRARLIVKKNTALGISADTVLDTATASSDLAWEQLTGTTAAVTDDGALEFVIDCDGTAGALYVDTFSATVA